jgi:c-di-GMP-binding flagellar brake protein YcgR
VHATLRAFTWERHTNAAPINSGPEEGPAAMLNELHLDAGHAHFIEGNRGLLLLMGQRFLVSILSVTPDTVRVSFPVQDFPMEGMYVNLEFHDDLGYATYESEVIASPKEPGDGLLLRRPPDAVRTHHRSSWRVAADFHVEMKGHVHPRRYDAPVINISGGGMLVRSDAPLNFGDSVDITFDLPGDSRKTALAQVVHLNVPSESQGGVPLVGLRFISPDAALTKAITMYIWRRLRQTHPKQILKLRRQSDLV